jgi:hypothetical protein
MTKSTPTTKSLADSTMALLGKAMDRNSHLAATVPPPAKAPAPVAVAAIASLPGPPVTRMPAVAPTRPAVRTSGLRFTAHDHERINRIINQALSLGERIPMSDAVRLALIAYDPRSLTTADLAALHATDGRIRRRAASQ